MQCESTAAGWAVESPVPEAQGAHRFQRVPGHSEHGFRVFWRLLEREDRLRRALAYFAQIVHLQPALAVAGRNVVAVGGPVEREHVVLVGLLDLQHLARLASQALLLTACTANGAQTWLDGKTRGLIQRTRKLAQKGLCKQATSTV